MENKLNRVFKSTYPVRIDHQILTHNSVFFPRALYQHLSFELTLAPPEQVVLGSDTSKLKYALKNIKMDFETIHSRELAEATEDVYTGGKEFLFDNIRRDKMVVINKGTDEHVNIQVNPQKRSLKGILLIFIEPYTYRTRDSEKYTNPDITKVNIGIKGSNDKVFSKGLEDRHM